jgi:hypothetical protein
LPYFLARSFSVAKSPFCAYCSLSLEELSYIFVSIQFSFCLSSLICGVIMLSLFRSFAARLSDSRKKSVVVVLALLLVTLCSCQGPSNSENAQSGKGASSVGAVSSGGVASHAKDEAKEQAVQLAGSEQQRLLLFVLVEPPCTLSDVSGASVSPLRLVFVGPRINETPEVPRGLSFEPQVEGSWSWTAKNELTFRPKAEWMSREYKVRLDGTSVPPKYALDKSEVTFAPRGSCVNTSSIHFPYKITAPGLPTRPTDTLPDQLLISFDRPVAAPEKIQQVIKDEITLKPALEGEWRWMSERELVFAPRSPWSSGTNYEFTISPQVFAKDAVVPGYDYRFSTPQSNIERARSGYQVQRPGTPTYEKDSKPDVLSIVFSDPVAASELIDKQLSIVPTLSPQVAGEWRWVSDRTITFRPKAHWSAGAEYGVSFDSRLFGDKEATKPYYTTFVTPSLGLSFTSSSLYVDPSDPKTKRVIATVVLSHPLDKGEFEKHVSFTLVPQTEKSFPDGSTEKSFGFKVTYDEVGREAYLQSDPVPVTATDAQMRIKVAAGVHSALGIADTTGPAETAVYVPNVENYFKVESITVAKVPNQQHGIDQVLMVSTTAGVLPEGQESKVVAKLLPLKNPEGESSDEEGKDKPYRWGEVSEVSPQVRSSASVLPLQLIPSAEPSTKSLGFKFKADVGRYLLVSIAPELKSIDDYALGKPYEQIVYVGKLPKAVQILSPGSLLSLTGEKKLSVMTRDVAKVEIEIARLLPQTVNQLVSQTYGTFSKPIFSSYSFGPDDLSERFTEVRDFSSAAPGEAQYGAVDFGALLNAKSKVPRGLFLLKLTEKAEALSAQTTDGEAGEGSDEDYSEESEGEGSEYYPSSLAEDQRLILLTNLGMVLKNNQNGSRDLFVQALDSGMPVSGATVKVLGRNGLPLVSTVTGADGHASFPKLSDFVREKSPTVFTVEKEGDFSFLPFQRDDRRLNLSRFDVGGLSTQNDAPGVQAYLFSDRGIYRPGDEIHVGVVVKSDDWKQDLSGLPLEAVFTDARGQEIRKEKVRFGPAGFEELRYQTLESSPTGRYEASLYVVRDGKRGAMLGSTSVRVEEFLPDRMTISTSLSPAGRKGWLAPKGLGAEVTLRNLFGTAAAKRRVVSRLLLDPSALSFKEYADFNFSDPLRAKTSFNQELEPTETNEEGIASLALNLDAYAPATYRLTLLTQGYEAEGGRFVASQVSSIVSPLEYLVGYHPHGDLSYLRKGSEHSIELVAINPDLKKIAVSGLKTKLLEQRWVSVLTKQSNGTFAYQSTLKEIPVKEDALNIPENGLSLALPTSEPGSFALVIADEKGLELNRVGFTIAGNADLSKRLESNTELEVKLDRKEYLPGDVIELQIKAPYAGSGLISIEKEKVYSYVWFKSDTTTSVQRIQVPRDLEGNGYVNVTFVRALDSKEVFLSPLSYGVQPFAISKAPRENKLLLSVAESAKPGETLRLKYRAEKPGRAVVFLVDEGILQVARYQNPDPLGYFFRRRALEVDTLQILDLLLPEYSIERALSAPGGDGDLLAKHLNPFKRKRDKPVVFWSGLIDVGPEEKELTYDIPEYFNGSLRAIAVVVSDGAIGVASKKTTVRGDFVIAPNVPSAVSPGDVFEVSASVTNSLVGSGKDAELSVALKVDPEALELVTSPEQKVKIAEGSEGVVRFSIKAKDKLGSANLRFEANSGPVKVGLGYDTSIRPASPLRTTMRAGASTGGSSEIDLERRDLYPFGALAEGSVSPLPLGFAHGLIGYLESYPYACSEQVVSMAVPALILKAHPDLGNQKEKAVEKALATALRTLGSRQNPDGSISLWYPGGEVSNEINNYAALFLAELKDRGYPIPVGVANDLQRYLKAIANRAPGNFADARNSAYAIYLLTRSGIVTTSYLTSLRAWFDNYENNKPKLGTGATFESWKKDISAAMLAATYKLLKDDAQAGALFSKVSLIEPVTPDYVHYYDSFMHGSLYLYLAAKHFEGSLKDLAPQTVMNYLKPLAENSYSTLSAGYALLALDAYMSKVAKDNLAAFSVEQIKADGTRVAVPLEPGKLYPRFSLLPDAAKLGLTSPGYLFYQTFQQGYDKAPVTEALKNGFEVFREYRNEAGNPITEVALGEKVTVVLRARSLIAKAIPHVSIVDMLPGGFEIEMSPNRFASVQENGDGETPADSSVWGFGIAGTTMKPDYADVREDRALIFTTVPESETVEFRYKLVPTNKGTFIVPPVYAESMYDRSLTSVFPGGTIKVQEAAPLEK